MIVDAVRDGPARSDPRPPSGAPPRECGGRGRRGFSLVEVIVAVFVLDVGVLALTGTAAAVARMTAAGNRSGGSSLTANARLDALRAGACALTAGGESGDALTGRYRERWTVAAAGVLRTIRLTVAYADGPADRTDVYETAVACAP